MPDIDQNFWKTVKIKELPRKTTIDENTYIIVEDNQDTKCMQVGAFFNQIQGMANEMLNQMKAKLVEIDTFFEELKAKDAQYAANEELRQQHEQQRILNETERREQFDEWIRIWDTDWTPFINQTKIDEQIRRDNEAARIEEFNRWTAMINQWEKDESERVKQENIRIANENNRVEEFNTQMQTIADTLTDFSTRVTQTINNCNTQIANTIADCKSQINTTITNVNNRIDEINAEFNEHMDAVEKATSDCNEATAKCIEVTQILNDMFDIGVSVPSNLKSGKVYFQYFN